MREPRVDHPRLGREGQVSGGELLESPLRALVRSGADLEDQRLTALAREGREVVVQVRQELEVDEEFDGRSIPPRLCSDDHPLRPHRLAAWPVHGEHRVDDRRLALVAHPEQLR